MQAKSSFSTSFFVPFGIGIALTFTGIYWGIHKTFIQDAPALLFTFTGVFITFTFLSVAKRIIIKEDVIIIRSLFTKCVFSVHDLLSIDTYAMGRDIFSYTYKTNGTRYRLKDLSEYFVADVYYNNVELLKTALVKNFGGIIIQHNTLITQTDNDDINSKEECYTGNPLFTSYSMTAVIVTILMACMVYAVNRHQSKFSFHSLVLLFPPVAVCALMGNQFYFFKLSGRRLIIKNHIWWWKSAEFNVHDIQQVVIENNLRVANSIRFNFKNFSTKKYFAGSLSNKTWRLFTEKLAAFGIEVYSDI